MFVLALICIVEITRKDLIYDGYVVGHQSFSFYSYYSPLD